MTARDPRSLAPSRRQVLALGAGAFVVAAIPLARGRRAARAWRRRRPVMGTFGEVVVVGEDAAVARRALDDAFAALDRVERRMSRFLAASDVGRLNAARPGEPVAIAAETATVLEAAREWAAASEGVFDPCLGRATALWDVTRRHAPPDEAAVAALRGAGRWRDLDLDRAGPAPRARLLDGRAAVDLGGIAKGWGVDEAARALRARGVQDGLVNVGGDLVALGRSADGDAWAVGVRDPEDPRRLVRTLAVEDAAVATSGDYARGFDHEGRRYHHLLDPREAAPRRARTHALTVLAPTAMEADAAATACFGLGGAASADLLRRRGSGARVVAGA